MYQQLKIVILVFYRLNVGNITLKKLLKPVRMCYFNPLCQRQNAHFLRKYHDFFISILFYLFLF